MDRDDEDPGKATSEAQKWSISPTGSSAKELEGSKAMHSEPRASPMANAAYEPTIRGGETPRLGVGKTRSSTKELEAAGMELSTLGMNTAGRIRRDLGVARREPRSSLPTPAGSHAKLPASLEPHRIPGVSGTRSRSKSLVPKKRTPHKWAQLTKPLVMVAVITSFGSSLQYGYNLWVVTHPAMLIQNFYNTTYQEKKKVNINRGFINFLYHLTTAFYSLGGLIGSLLSSLLVDRVGRRGALILNNVLSVASAILMGFTPFIFASEFTIFTRLLTGICSGVFSCTVPMYLGEVAPKTLRGTVISVSTISVAVGMLLSQILGFREILGNKREWPFLLSLMGFLAIFQLIVLPCFPESPRYLLIQTRNEMKARQALQKLRCQDSVDEELEEIYQEDASEKIEKAMGGLKILCSKVFRWQVISVIVLMGGQQLSGINVNGLSASDILVRNRHQGPCSPPEPQIISKVNQANYYAERIYITMWLSEHEARYITMMSTLALIITLMIVTYLIDTVGRRVLILLGFGVCSILCILLTMTLQLKLDTQLDSGHKKTVSWMSYISSGLVFAFLIGHIIGPGPVPNVLIAELFLQSSRSTGFALGGFVHWLLNFLTGLVFLHVKTRLGSYSFLLFWPFCFGAFLFIFKLIPETKGKSFLEIKRLMSLHVARKSQVQDSRRASTRTSSRKQSLKPNSRRMSMQPNSRRGSLTPNVKKKKRKAIPKLM